MNTRQTLLTAVVIVSITALLAPLTERLGAEPKKHYGEVIIYEFHRLASASIRISGKTNLPDGSVLCVGYGFPGESKAFKEAAKEGFPCYAEEVTEVANGAFQCDCWFYDNVPTWSEFVGDWMVLVTFSPSGTMRGRVNPRPVVDLVGEDGRYLDGPWLQEKMSADHKPYRWLQLRVLSPLH